MLTFPLGRPALFALTQPWPKIKRILVKFGDVANSMMYADDTLSEFAGNRALN